MREPEWVFSQKWRCYSKDLNILWNLRNGMHSLTMFDYVDYVDIVWLCEWTGWNRSSQSILINLEWHWYRNMDTNYSENAVRLITLRACNCAFYRIRVHQKGSCLTENIVATLSIFNLWTCKKYFEQTTSNCDIQFQCCIKVRTSQSTSVGGKNAIAMHLYQYRCAHAEHRHLRIITIA